MKLSKIAEYSVEKVTKRQATMRNAVRATFFSLCSSSRDKLSDAHVALSSAVSHGVSSHVIADDDVTASVINNSLRT